MGVYEYAKIVHLFCAIIFVGYLFFDVVVFNTYTVFLAATVPFVVSADSKVTVQYLLVNRAYESLND